MADIKRVIIDAGHGGEEPGAMYDGRREKGRPRRNAWKVQAAVLIKLAKQISAFDYRSVYLLRR